MSKEENESNTDIGNYKAAWEELIVSASVETINAGLHDRKPAVPVDRIRAIHFKHHLPSVSQDEAMKMVSSSL